MSDGALGSTHSDNILRISARLAEIDNGNTKYIHAARLSLKFWEGVLSRFQPQRGCMFPEIDLNPRESCFSLVREDDYDIDCSFVFNGGFAVLSDVTQNTTLKQM
jgi:hypothetical protein